MKNIIKLTLTAILLFFCLSSFSQVYSLNQDSTALEATPESYYTTPMIKSAFSSLDTLTNCSDSLVALKNAAAIVLNKNKQLVESNKAMFSLINKQSEELRLWQETGHKYEQAVNLLYNQNLYLAEEYQKCERKRKAWWNNKFLWFTAGVITTTTTIIIAK